MKVKIFIDDIIEDLEDKFNKWMEENIGEIKVVNVKYSSNTNLSEIAIFYEEK